ncbi:hypothetical protein [Streptomyces sp. NPDC047928]|uniref:hypothetical protein n=1 Tax=unclassified Streptomyces TaxID=2593676 RepID=UPI0037103C2F
MARMRRGLVHAMAWSLATGAAVTLSWWGVHTVMAGTAYDPPRALPLTAERPTLIRPAPDSSSTRRPKSEAGPSGSPSPAGSGTPSASPSRTASASASATSASLPPTTGPSKQTGTVRSYAVDGGQVVFDLGAASAELVSATPASGWQMQVWKQTTWIRVTFTQGNREVSVFCVWHDTAPRVEIDERRR